MIVPFERTSTTPPPTRAERVSTTDPTMPVATVRVVSTGGCVIDSALDRDEVSEHARISNKQIMTIGGKRVIDDHLPGIWSFEESYSTMTVRR
jgi:hypothetical protein